MLSPVGFGAVVIQVHRQRHPCSPAPALERSPAPALEQLPEHCRRPGVAGRRVGSEVAGEQQQPAQPRVLGRGRPSLSDRRRRCRSTTALPHPSRRRRVHPAQPVAVDGVQLRDSSAWGRCSTEGVRIVRGRPSPTSSGSAAPHPRDRRPCCGSLSLRSTTGTPKPVPPPAAASRCATSGKPSGQAAGPPPPRCGCRSRHLHLKAAGCRIAAVYGRSQSSQQRRRLPRPATRRGLPETRRHGSTGLRSRSAYRGSSAKGRNREDLDSGWAR